VSAFTAQRMFLLVVITVDVDGTLTSLHLSLIGWSSRNVHRKNRSSYINITQFLSSTSIRYESFHIIDG